MSGIEIFGIVLGAIAFLIGLWFLFGFVVFKLTLVRNSFTSKIISSVMNRNYKKYKIEPTWWNKQKTEEIIINNSGLNLAGLLIRKENSNKVAICVHGLFGTYKDVMPQANLFLENGFSVIAPSHRAHGKSQGKYITMGHYEKDDIVLWIKKAIEIFGQNCQIVLFGISMGGATVLLSAGENLPSNVKCVIADSAYKNGYAQFAAMVHKVLLPGIVFLPPVNFFFKKISKFNLLNVLPIEAVKKTNLPILFIHGTHDLFVPNHMSKDMFKVSNKENCKLLLVKGAIHIQSFAKNTVEYKKTFTNFVEKWVN